MLHSPVGPVVEILAPHGVLVNLLQGVHLAPAVDVGGPHGAVGVQVDVAVPGYAQPHPDTLVPGGRHTLNNNNNANHNSTAVTTSNDDNDDE